MNKIEYLARFVQYITDEHIQFIKMQINVGCSGILSIPYNLFYCTIANEFICFGANVMCKEPLIQDCFVIIAGCENFAVSHLKPATIFNPSHLTNDAPDGIVIIELQSMWKYLRIEHRSDEEEKCYQTHVWYNRQLMELFERIYEYVHDNYFEAEQCH